MSLVKQLYQLQQVDSEQQAKATRLTEVLSGLGESSDLIRARESVAEVEGKLKKTHGRLRALELEIATVSDKLKQNQDRLYGGRVRNPKELSSLQEEATALRRRVSELEDEQLELMIGLEEDEAELAERQARQRQIEANWRDEQAALQAEKDRLEQRLAELHQQRKAMRARLRAADLALYDDLRDRQAGVAVGLLKGGICQVCGVDVPTTVARAVERAEGMHYCPICNRLLCGG